MSKQIVFLVLILVGLIYSQTTPTCLDGSGAVTGPFAKSLTDQEKTVFYSNGVPCITCEIDCLAFISYNGKIKERNPTPFASCPCRYIRYGCTAHQPCASLNSTTPRQWETAFQLCLSYGCKLVTNINVESMYSQFSVGQDTWEYAWKNCYKASINGLGYQAKQNYLNGLKVGDSPITDSNLANARSCELSLYKKNYLNAKPAAVNPLADRKVLQEAYQYANAALDVASSFMIYQYYLFSKYSLDEFKNSTRRSEVLSKLNSNMKNIPDHFLTRSALFRVTDAEISNLFEQREKCGAGKTRADAFYDIMDKFVVSLNYSDACVKETGNPFYIEHFFDAQYKQLLNSLNIDISAVYSEKDQGRNVAYGHMFYTSSRNNIQLMGSNANKITDNFFSFTGKGNVCPTFATFPGCVKRAMIKASGQ